MRTQIKQWILTVTVVAALSFATRAHALYTTHLDEAVVALTGASNYFASLPSPTKNDKKHFSAVKKALKDLSKPSTSVAGDFNLFFLAVVHLGDLVADPVFGPTLDSVGTNAFNGFVSDAQVSFLVMSRQLAALNDFVKVKKAASNQLNAVYSTLVTLSTTTNKQLGLLLGRQVFARLEAANKLLVKGQAQSGLAPANLVGFTLHHDSNGEAGEVKFLDDTHATQTNSEGTLSHTYTYTRTGLNTATLLVNETSGTSTVKLKFTSGTGGSFTYSFVDESGTESGKGTFTLSH